MNKKGYVFLCADGTQTECLDRMLFGGGELYAKRVKGLEVGDILFLYNYESRRLLGIFEAQTELQKNIVADAWGGGYPQQVRVERIENHRPLSREDIGGLLKYFRNKPTAKLTPETVNALVDLFRGEKRVVQYDDTNRYPCKDGHKVKSKAEEVICNWLFEHRIPHAYEFAILAHPQRSDFYIPRGDSEKEGVYIEYWGLTSEDYIRNREHKELIYKKHDLDLISIDHHKEKQIPDILEHELAKRDVKVKKSER